MNRKRSSLAVVTLALVLPAAAPVAALESYDAWLCTLTGTLLGFEASSRATLSVERTTVISPTQVIRETVNTNLFGAHRYAIGPKYSTTLWPQHTEFTFVGTSVVPGIWVHNWSRVRLPYEHCIFFDLSGSVQPGAASADPDPALYRDSRPGLCTPDREPPEKDKTNCPVVLDIGRNGYRLTGAEAGVRFDIDADGINDQIGWTRAADDDALLCWDRNGNGLIDDGRELFGWATPLAAGSNAGIGYAALAELDEADLGGNGDGWITLDDSAWSNLCVWTDGNHDGQTQAGELSAPGAHGIAAFAYAYREQARRDSHGNLFRYASSMLVRTSNGHEKPWPTYDVIFTE